MANGRNLGRKRDLGRDPGGFVALPWSVLDCAAYAALSYPARALLLEFARQFVGDNNGRLLASLAYLSKRGWNSNDVIMRAKRDLLKAGFIHETVKGARPNKASWYAVTWRALDKLPGYDAGSAHLFRRGLYLKDANLRPVPGIEKALIAPDPGIERSPSTPSAGAMRMVSTRRLHRLTETI